MTQNIIIPDIGDFESVEVIEVLVKVGDQINKDDPIVTLESDKSSVEVTSPFSGKISELKVKIGDKVSKGSLLAKLENSSSKINDENFDKDEVEEKNAWRDFGRPLRSAREGFERDYLEFHLHQTGGNISELARRAELERTHLYRKLKGLGINPKAEKYRE